MRVGKVTEVRSAICTSDEERIIVRGKELSRQLIGQVDFSAYFFLLVTGKLPTPAQSAVLNATLVAIAEHGLVPSVQAARMTLAAGPEALQGAVAAGILGAGSVVLGSSESAGRFLIEVDRAIPRNGGDLHAAARAIVAERRSKRQPIPGYGHPEHKARDPRVGALFDVSAAAGAGQHYVDVAKAVEEVIPELVGRELKLNVSGAIPAVLLGIEFPIEVLKGVPILGRTASIIGHLYEEQLDPIAWELQHRAVAAQKYTGSFPS